MKELDGFAILVVDDDPDLREVLTDDLQSQGCETFEAANGEIALQMIKNYKIDLVISDIRMPGGDGIELLEQAMQLNKPPSFIMMTGFSGITPEGMRKKGASEVLLKPFDREKFMKTVMDVLWEKLKSAI